MRRQVALLASILVVALLALAASTGASDGNPCRHIEIFDPWINGMAVFDLSSLIDHEPWKVNQTWNGVDWEVWTFGVCKPLATPCRNTEEGSVSMCGEPHKAALCQEFTDTRKGPGSFCASSWNGTIYANLDGDGERGLMIMYQRGDTHDEFPHGTNMLMNIECDPTVETIKSGDIYVTPPFADSVNYIVSLRHKSGCPANVHVQTPAQPPAQPSEQPPSVAKKSGMPGPIVGLIAIAMLLIGLFGGAFVGLWLNSKYGWFADPHRQAMAYTQFELDEDI